jgi:hypothetical protein
MSKKIIRKSKRTVSRKAKPGSLHPVVGHPSKFKIGDKVSVPVRFGETGTVKEIKDGRYGVEFHNLPMTLWYDDNELRPQTGQGFRWFRMPNS